MPMRLAPHVHIAVVGDDVVLLDCRADAYMCVPDGKALLKPAADRRCISPAPPEIGQALAEAGLTRAVAEPDPALTPPLPSRDLDSVSPRVTLSDAARLAGAPWDLFRHYRNKPFADVVAFAAAGAARHRRPAAGDALRLAAVFQRVVVWLPISRKCLVRSFLLLRFLQRSGQAGRWVFGVRTWPFAAHCWIQVGPVALDDAVERLAAYEPIMAVG